MIDIKRKQSGYSLLELSIVLLILGFISLGLIGIFNFSVSSNSRAITEERMEVIQDALVSFVSANGRLPCPAVYGLDTSENMYGYEAGVQLPFFECSFDLLISSLGMLQASLPIFMGMVPVNTLGLNSEYAFDGYGNRFSYVISVLSANSSIITQNNLSVPSTNQSCDPNNAAAVGVPSYCFAFKRTRPDIDDMSIFETVGGNLINGYPEYILISYGQNGAGAFGRGADQKISGGALVDGNVSRETFPNGADELANLDCANGSCGQTMLNFHFVQRIESEDFDDILRFDTKNNIIAKCNQFSNYICSDQINGHGMLIDN